jgi:twitching motility protein PilT
VPAAPATAPPAPTPRRSLEIDQLLTLMTRQGASDLHLKPMRPPLLRLDGKLLPLRTEPLQLADLDAMVQKILTEPQRKRLEERMSVDLGYGVPGVARFRGNFYFQRGHLAACFRRIPYEIKAIEELDLPRVIYEFCAIPMGLVLITGPTGSGKSTTLAGMVKYVTTTRPVHVITIEDPMEFLFSDGMASVSQRELGTDTYAFAEALRNAMRQDPDVIMVGEMRDRDTIQTVITAAETGHLVFSTLHTNTAPQTVDRILDSFPADQQGQIRTQLGQVLKAVVSMKLVKRRDGKGRIAALEILRGSPKISKMIEQGLVSELHDEMESSVGYYRMQSMNQSLMALLVHNEITYEEAMAQSSDPEDLSLKLRKMFPNIEEKGGAVSTSDFAEIQELQQYRKLYEEQEEKVKMRIGEKDEELAQLQKVIRGRDHQISDLDARIQDLNGELERMRGDYARLRDEAQQKIDKLMDRIRELNTRLTGGAAAPAPAPVADKKTGIFR